MLACKNCGTWHAFGARSTANSQFIPREFQCIRSEDSTSSPIDENIKNFPTRCPKRLFKYSIKDYWKLYVKRVELRITLLPYTCKDKFHHNSSNFSFDLNIVISSNSSPVFARLASWQAITRNNQRCSPPRLEFQMRHTPETTRDNEKHP